ncbi:MAG: hypothetical protein J6W19_04305 [Prevotella sp.]|nr:hypothetical protein [Prevotella sp.]
MITFGFNILKKKCKGTGWVPVVIIFIIFHFSFLISGSALAQRKELSQARTFIKNKKYDDAEKLVAPLLKDSANRQNKRVWEALYDIVHGKYAQANDRLYLKQKQDTAAFFALARRMVSVAETLDSLTDDDRKSHSAEQHVHRVNLFNGGIYFVRKSKWQEAYDFMEAYIDCARQPLFEAYHYDSLDQRMPQAAYWATYSGYMLHDPVLTLRHRQLALRDSSKTDFTLQFIAEARLWLKDQELYLYTLQEGFRRNPLFPYFFPRLFDVYTSRGEYDRALAVADSALAVSDSSQLFLFAKSTTLLSMGRYAESIKIGEKLIGINDSLPEPYFNVGTAYINIADRLDTKKERKLVKQAYQKAMPYMEHYRKLMPEEKQKWGPALYRIYLNLNMGRQFDEIDRLLRK